MGPSVVNYLNIKHLSLVLAGIAVGFSLAAGKSLVADSDPRRVETAGLSAEESRLLADVSTVRYT